MGHEGSIYEGKTLEDAVRKGLESLGLTRAEAKITVLEEGSGGFLGIGSRPFRVQILQRPGGAMDEPAGRGTRGRGGRGDGDRRGRRNGNGGRGRGGRDGGDGRREGRRESRREGRGDGRAQGRGDGRRRERPARTEQRPARETVEARGDTDNDRERRRRRGRRGGRRRREREEARPSGERPGLSSITESMAAEPAVAAPVAQPRPEREPAAMPVSSDAPVATVSQDELAGRAKRCAEDLLGAMGFDATVEVSTDDDRVNIGLSVGDNEDLLTGPKGEVRQSLQHLLNLMLNQGGGARYHLQLEINDFWKRREGELAELAKSLAEEALEKNGEAMTEYLNAQERRIVHVALRDDTRVKTYALGTGLIKRVAVAPADFPEPGPEH